MTVADEPSEEVKARRAARVEEVREHFAKIVRREHGLADDFKVKFHPDARCWK